MERKEEKKRQTITIPKLVKEVQIRVGAGLPTKLVDRLVKETIKAIIKNVLEGNKVKLGKISLGAKVIEEPIKKEFRNPATGEKFIKTIQPHIKLKVNPTKVELQKKDEIIKMLNT